MTRFTAPEHLISNLESSSTVALTAPVFMKDRVLIGFALSDTEAHCLELGINEFKSLCTSMYRVDGHSRFDIETTAFHGLKRIWEFLDEMGLNSVEEAPNALNLKGIQDTRLMAYLLDPDSSQEVKFGDNQVQEKLTFAHVAHRYLGRDYPYRITDIYDKASWDLAAEMLAYDAGLIFELAEKLPTLMSHDLQKLYNQIELPLMPLLDNMRRVGIGFDGEKCGELIIETERGMAALAADITGGESVDLSSNESVYDFLTAKGVPVRLAPAQVKRGLKKPLGQIAHSDPLIRKMLSWWNRGEDLGFLRRWAGHSRIHPTWGQTRSATSRIYARSPAVQNVSRRLRGLFVPKSGHALIKADYSQAQMRIIAHLSEDPELMRIFRDPNGDVHMETSERLGLNDRSVAKEINFAICFGMGAPGLCTKINELRQDQGSTDFINGDTARSYIKGFYRRFPKVKEFFDREWKKMKKLPSDQRIVRSLAGRERHFPRWPTFEVERQFRVTWPQQIEADLIKTAMLRLDRIFRRRSMDARIVMMIHDALWVECPEKEAEQVKHLTQRMMITSGKLRVPLDVDIQICKIV
ncbi:DNA polymerase [Desulfomonile tiedjei]|uniref:DNA polymerase n=1 Tax=Desulfomonile tiedjei TaxID=2358 RepID=UPI00059E094B|nr:DNA polymerase [Desulfomonile tiedjei]